MSMREEPGWEPHPLVPGLERKVLLTRAADGAPCTLYLFRRQPGGPPAPEASPHVHAHSEDITYVLQGSARLWRADRGEEWLHAGAISRIPAGVSHQVGEFSEDFFCINVFIPPVE